MSNLLEMKPLPTVFSWPLHTHKHHCTLVTVAENMKINANIQSFYGGCQRVPLPNYINKGDSEFT